MLIICSDGLTNMIPESEILDIALNNSPENVADVLVDSANEAGGLDNITVIFVDNR